MDLGGRVAELLGATVTDIEEPDGGHQSRVFGVVGGEQAVIVAKVLAGGAIEREEVEARAVVVDALADLHRAMAELPSALLPAVAALRALSPVEQAKWPSRQLLHGDFQAGNLRVGNGTVRVFDSFVLSAPETYRVFRTGFVRGYADARGDTVADQLLDHFIDLRVVAPRSWLDDPGHAPIGIRTAPTEWLAALASFVATYQSSAN